MYEQLCSIENLLSAFDNAHKGKSNKYYVKRFEKNLSDNIMKLRLELLNESYKPHPLKVFIINDPKTRKISKSRFRDRIVHHALINIIGRLFENEFIYDSHANQKGKGTLKAVQRFNIFKRKVSRNNTKDCYVLKADIKHYFDEIDHKILLSIIKMKVNDEKIINLISKILKNSARSGGGGKQKKVCP